MSMTRSTLVTLVNEMADANGSPRWGTTLTLQLLGEAHWREWKDLLNANRMLRVQTCTATTDADGRIAKSALNSGSGDSATYHYRILSLSQGNWFYQPARYEDYPISPTDLAQPYVWYEYGDQIQVIPSAQGNTVTAVVNHIPQRADLLASDASTVIFPDGYELILAYETAASMFTKGAAETQLAAELLGRAQALRDRLHQDVRITTRPIRVGYTDDKFEWGSTY